MSGAIKISRDKDGLLFIVQDHEYGSDTSFGADTEAVGMKRALDWLNIDVYRTEDV